MTTEPTVSALPFASDEGFAPRTEKLVHIESVKRDKTGGEHLFNGITYAGVALIGNEVASNFVLNQIKGPHDGKPAGSWRPAFKKFEGMFANLKELKFIPASVKKFIPEYVVGNNALVEAEKVAPRLPFLLFATIGGMFMVPPVKWLEDNKGSIVRKFDQWIHGKKAEQDPAMIETHKEMDRAPKQTWESLGKGRIITVVAAALADATFGWKRSLTGRALQSEHLQKYKATAWMKDFASLDHLAEQTANGVMKLGKIEKDSVQYNKWHGTAENLTWLLTLSTTLTMLFYVTSKLFAKDERKHHNAEDILTEQARIPLALADAAPSVAAPAAAVEQHADKPTARVTQVAHQEALDLSHAPQLG